MTTDMSTTCGWQFFIDRGGTFTDVVARSPDGELRSLKLLSENPGRYDDAAIEGIRRMLGAAAGERLPEGAIDAVKMGTTVGTNALLERRGEPTAFVTTEGFGDLLRIGYQNRPDIFALNIVKPQPLYDRVVEVPERISARGEVLIPVDIGSARERLQAARDAGIVAAAICLLHAYRHPAHEQQLEQLCRELGFTQISVSHRVSPLMRAVGRGDTTVADAYLSPVLGRYVAQVRAALPAGTTLLFMQSSGGLADAERFHGKDSILSGPAGGIVGAVTVSQQAGYERVIGFDMGGTSTDVAHFSGEYERRYESEVAGVRVRAPMLAIHTVAAGGGSVLHFDGARFRVGPDSAGADPGPACYRRNGPLCVTDANLMLGRIQAEHFPHVFGVDGDRPLDLAAVRAGFEALQAQIAEATGETRSPEAIAEGFLAIAVENMAAAIKRISIERGHDVTKYTLCAFGGAGGQHACRVADALGIEQVLCHPLAGVLSAYGMGLAARRVLRERAVELPLDEAAEPLDAALSALEQEALEELSAQGVERESMEVHHSVHLRYSGTDSALAVPFASPAEMAAAFTSLHRTRYGFVFEDRALVVEAAVVEAVEAAADDAPTEGPRARSASVPGPQTSTSPSGARVASEPPDVKPGARVASEPPVGLPRGALPPWPLDLVPVYLAGAFEETPIFERERLEPGHTLHGPAIVIEPHATIVVEPGWNAAITAPDQLLLTRREPLPSRRSPGIAVDPVMLEIFNRRFQSIAEQMGETLRNTAHSVNIKERLDFSCALFDGAGNLVANAPHLPVHLGSMMDSVKAVIAARGEDLLPGDVFLNNSPYLGGTHVPDVTVVTPLFDDAGEQILFFAASRGHHADIGGTTPGSMPPFSTTIEEEGVTAEALRIVSDGRFLEHDARDWLGSGAYPARNPEQNLADLGAQVAANQTGLQELRRMVAEFSLPTVRAYMRHVRDNAEASVRRAIAALDDGRFEVLADAGARIVVTITVDREARRARIDFGGTSACQPSNANAPAAVTRAAVLYVFRALVQDEIPLNAGCLAPLEIVIPEGSMLDPRPPAAVVAGNVETSQLIADALLGALGRQAGCQGTMNNVTFGNARLQHYETVCGGAGAGPHFHGADAVQTHMTNSRITDPEVLEWRFPVVLERFAIRAGSGGAGRHRGGRGAVRAIRFLEPMTAAILSGRRRVAPHGLQGGEPGATGRNALHRADGTLEELEGRAEVRVEPGEVLVVETPGGGGFGGSGGRPDDE